jgi:hypothetical protein
MSLYDEGLVEDIGRLLARKDLPHTTSATNSRSATSLAARFGAESDRVSRVRLAREMYDTDTRYEGIVDTLARDATKGGFQIEVENNDEAQAIANGLMTRLKLATRLDDWVRLSLRDGDSFYELGVTNEREIVQVTRKPTLHMRRNSDKTDRFPEPKMAYWYADEMYMMQPGPDSLWFAEWQILHVRWKHDEGNRYGRPLLSSGRTAWKRIKEGELDVAVRRKTRAGTRYLHVVEGDETAIEAYRLRNADALNNPGAAQADFYTNRPGSVSAIGGDQHVGSIDDIVHHIDTLWIGSPVPKSILGYGRDLNRDVLQEQKEQYDETLEAVVGWVKEQMLIPLLELQWLLKGILPETVTYSITRPSKAVVKPGEILQIAQAAQILRTLNVPEDVIAMVLAHYLPNITPDMLAMQSNAPPADAGRLAAIQQQLFSLLPPQGVA